MYHVIEIFLCGNITVLGVILFAKIILNTKIKVSKLQFILIFILSSIIYSYTFMNFEGTFKTIIMFLINTFIYKTVFGITYQKSLFLNVMYAFVIIIPDMIDLFFITKVLNLSKEFCYEDFAGSLIGNITVFILFIITTVILMKPLRKIINYKIENNLKIIIFSVLTFICIIMFFFTFISEYRNDEKIIQYIIVMTVSILILLSHIKQTIENDKLTKKYDKILEFMTTYEIEVEKERTLRHETKNEFLNIKGQLVDNNPKDKIIDYINDILSDKTKIKFEEYAKFHYLPPNGIKGLCYFKVSEAQKKGILVGINISPQVTESTIYDLNVKEQREFGKMLGVFLDNAIEASSVCEKKQIGIEAYCRFGEFKMIISNTHNNEVDTSKIGKEKFSTKGKNRGHGLILVKNIVENNPKFDIKTDVNDELYIQYIIIKKSI